jgi:branched-chain amino acid transport system substrate-binding protein
VPGARPVLVAVLVTLTAALAGCSQPVPPRAAPPPVRLGALIPLTGSSAPIGTSMVPAYRMAVDEANRAGGVLGRRVEVVTEDDACDPATAVSHAREMVADDIAVSVGGLCSAATLPTLKVFHGAGIPMIIPGSNSTELLAPRYDSVFLLAGTTAIEAQRAVSWMRPLGSRRLALVGDGTSFSSTIVDSAAAAARQLNGDLTVAAQLALSQGASGYPRIVEAVQAANADMVFFTGYYAEAGKLIRDLRAAGYAGKIMLSDGGVDPALFTEIDRTRAEGVYGLALPLPQFEPKATAWSARYRKITATAPGPFTMQAYDAVKLALDAVRRAGTLDRAKIRDAIATTAPGDVTLLSGPSTFQADGTQQHSTFVPLMIRDGAFTPAPVVP